MIKKWVVKCTLVDEGYISPIYLYFEHDTSRLESSKPCLEFSYNGEKYVTEPLLKYELDILADMPDDDDSTNAFCVIFKDANGKTQISVVVDGGSVYTILSTCKSYYVNYVYRYSGTVNNLKECIIMPLFNNLLHAEIKIPEVENIPRMFLTLI